jgi:hypothetical protein
MLTAFLVVGAAAYTMVKPFVDQMMGRDAASVEEKGANF